MIEVAEVAQYVVGGSHRRIEPQLLLVCVRVIGNRLRLQSGEIFLENDVDVGVWLVVEPWTAPLHAGELDTYERDASRVCSAEGGL